MPLSSDPTMRATFCSLIRGELKALPLSSRPRSQNPFFWSVVRAKFKLETVQRGVCSSDPAATFFQWLPPGTDLEAISMHCTLNAAAHRKIAPKF